MTLRRVGPLALAVVVLCGGTAAHASRGPSNAQGVALDPGLFGRLASGSALIRTYTCKNRPIAAGRGFLVGTRLVMTASHVLTDACNVKVNVGGLWFAGTKWDFWHAKNKQNESAVDVATILLDQDAPGHVFTIRTWSMARGAAIAMVGHPLGALQPSITQGSVLLKLTYHGIPLLANRLLIAEGSSGSPLLDAKGNVVGIAQKGLTAFDLLGQRTSGVTIGIDLPSWWKTAKDDLCRTYPGGGIQGCPGTTPLYHVKACWAQYAPYGTRQNPDQASTSFSAADVLRRAVDYAFFVALDGPPTYPIPYVTETLVEPNGATFAAYTFGWGTVTLSAQNFGFAFPDNSLFFTHPDQTGANPWTFRWSFPDGESCSTTVTIGP
jgi:hypothetical protein